MNIQELYRITSHKKIVDVDDVSTSINKVSNQVLIIENQAPGEKLIAEKFKNTSLGTILVVDAFDKDSIETFDYIQEDENRLMAIKTFELEGERAVLCLPENFITFYLGQELTHSKKIFKAVIITISDKAHRGIKEDIAGPKCAERLTHFFDTIKKHLDIKLITIPDNKDELELRIEEAQHDSVDLAITIGGLGLSKRDITVETIKPLLQREIPGIMEAIRHNYGATFPNILLFDSIAGIINKTLVYTLPEELPLLENYLGEVFNTLDQLFYMLNGINNQ